MDRSLKLEFKMQELARTARDLWSQFFRKSIWLALTSSITSTFFVLSSSIAIAQTVTVRSGNGTLGGIDSNVTFLQGPADTDFTRSFTQADFSNARQGPEAFIISPNPLWLTGLSADPNAKWIGANSTSSVSQGYTGLYAVSFTISNPFTSAVLSLHYAVDDAIGNDSNNTGIYLNGAAVCGNLVANGLTDFTQEHDLTCNDAGSQLHVGTNWLYIDAANNGGPAGLLFSATITTVDVTALPSGFLAIVPGTTMPWLYGTTPGGLNSSYQYGINDGTLPVVLSSAQGLNFSAGSVLTITYYGGTVSFGQGVPYNDANGDPADVSNSLKGVPSSYMDPSTYPINLGELVGTFAENNGSIVGIPFAVGDGPRSVVVPMGASQLQLGVNDTIFSDNTGSWLIQVGSSLGTLPTISTSGLVNAASNSVGPMAPGSIAAVIGSFTLNSSSIAPSGMPWPTSLGGLSLHFDGIPAPLYYASGSQVNFQVPWELAGRTPPNAPLTVTVGNQTSSSLTVNLAPFSPGLFSMNAQGNGQGAILDSHYRLVDSSNPASMGDVIQIYCTGLGAVTNQPPSGSPALANPLSWTTTQPRVTIGGAAATVYYSGLTPDVGLNLINAQIPSGIVTGPAVPVVVSIGGVTSNTVTVAIQPFPVSPNPQPSVTSLAPTSATVGTNSLTLPISGSAFMATSTVTFNGVLHSPSLVNSGQLTINLSAADLATVGTFPVIVNNPPPGGGNSQSVNFTVMALPNPQPSIASLSPTSATVSTSPLVLTINGSGFIASSTVTFNGILHPPSLVNGGQLNITLTASDLSDAGSFQVVVTNPAPGGGTSGTVNFNALPASVPVPPAPTGLSPGSTIPPGPTVNSLTPTLSWNPSPGATGYTVVIINTVTGNSAPANVTATSVVSPTLTNGGTYLWSVAAFNSSGLGPVAAPVYFTVALSQTGLTGNWTGDWGSIPSLAVGTMSATLVQTGSTLSGSLLLSSTCFPGGPVSGTVSGSTINATITISGFKLATIDGNVSTDGRTINGAYVVTYGLCTGDYGVYTLSRAQ
jgi:uncharacterized protein (TIGR03437 family)